MADSRREAEAGAVGRRWLFAGFPAHAFIPVKSSAGGLSLVGASSIELFASPSLRVAGREHARERRAVFCSLPDLALLCTVFFLSRPFTFFFLDHSSVRSPP